ncbi:MAG: family 16 glycoside hydrolase [Verrucomicrobiota bacterium]
MKYLVGLVVFGVVLLAIGLLTHLALFGEKGFYVWSFQPDPETGSSQLVRTVIPVNPPAGAPQIEKGEDPASAETPEATDEPEVVTEPDPEPEKDPNLFELFDGEDLGSWKSTRFGGEGEVFVNEDGNLEFDLGAVMTGVTWTEAVPATSNYELSLDAMKLEGHDFFCAVTFPVKDSHASLIIGGWGGGVVGISNVDDLDAASNETMTIEGFRNDVWHQVRIRVTDDKLMAWIDDEVSVDLPLEDRKISLRAGEIELSAPLGIASFQTRAQYRNIVWRNLTPKEISE